MKSRSLPVVVGLVVVGLVAVTAGWTLLASRPQAPVPAGDPEPLLIELAEAPAAPESAPPADAAPPVEHAPAPAVASLLAEAAEPQTEPSPPDVHRRVVAHGRVTDNAGNPLAGAAIGLSILAFNRADGTEDMMMRVDLGSAATGADGRYRHTFLLPAEDMGMLSLAAMHEGFAMASASRLSFDPETGPAADSTDAIDWEWNPVLSPEATLAGRVVDDKGAPISGVWLVAIPLVTPAMDFAPVDVDESRALATTTDESGAFAFAGAMAAPYYVGATRLRGVIEVEREIDAPADDIELVLYDTTARVSGTVINQNTGEAVTGVQLRLAGGPDLMAMMAEQREPGQRELASLMAHQRSLVVPAPTEIESVVSGPDGTFTLSGIAAGIYTVVLVSDPVWILAVGQKPVTVYEGQHLEGVEVLVHDGHVVKGGVYLAGTSNPVPGIRVVMHQAWTEREVTDQTPLAVTDARGRYTLRTRLPLGMISIDSTEYQIVSATAQSGGYDSARFVNFSDPNRPEEVDLEVAQTLSVSGFVRTNDGERVGEGTVEVAMQRAGFGPTSKRTGAVHDDGTFRVAVPPNSAFSLRYEGPSYPVTHSELLHVLDRSLEGVEIVVGAAATISGRVVGPDERPVAGAQVTASYLYPVAERTWHHQNYPPVRSGPGGEFTIRNLPARSIRLEATAEGYGKSRRAEYMLDPGSHRTDARIVLSELGVLAGRVVDENDQPRGNVSLNVNGQGGDLYDHHYTNVGPDGTFRFNAVAGVRYTFHVFDSRGQLNFARFSTIAPDENIVLKGTTVDPNQDRPPSPEDRVLFLGSVRDANTKHPLDAFHVEYDRNHWHSGPPIQRDRTVAGLFRLEIPGDEIPPLIVTAPGYAPSRSPQIDITPAMREAGVHQHTYEMLPGATIVGRTVSEETGEPLPGVSVELKGVLPQPWQEPARPIAVAVSDEDGRFRLAGAATGTNLLRFRPPSPYMRDRRDVAVNQADSTVDAGDILIGKGRVVTVEVFDTATQSPVPGVSLGNDSFGGPRPDPATGNKTGRDGRITYRGVTYESFSLTVEGTPMRASLASGREDTTVRLPVGKATLEVLFTYRGEPVTPNHWNVGRGSGSGDGVSSKRPPDGIADMGISIYHSPTFRDGRVVLADLAAGSWGINAGYEVASAQSPYRHANQQVVLVDHEVVSIEIVFDDGKISGTVVDSEGLPVAGARVTGTNNLSVTLIVSATTDAQGRFEMTDAQYGPHTVRAEKEGVGVAVEHDVQVGMGRPATDLVLRLEPPTGGTLISRVYRLADGEPIPLAWCKLFDAENNELHHGQLRREDGTMRIDNIPAGRYRVLVSYWSHSIATRHVDIVAGQEVEIEDVLYGAGAIRANVSSSSGAALRNRAWTLTPEASNTIEQPRQGTTDNNGEAVIRGLYPGTYRLGIAKANGDTHAESFTVIEGEVTQREVVVVE